MMTPQMQLVSKQIQLFQSNFNIRHGFPGLTSTRNSETVFSVMEILKIKYCFKLNNNHLHMCMRMVLTPCKHRFKMLAEQAGV